MKPTRRVAPTPDTHGPLTVRVLTDLTERPRFDALLEAGHLLGPRFLAGDRLYQVTVRDNQWVGLLLWCAPALHLKGLDALADVLTRWLLAQAGHLPASLALDGKIIRNHPGCSVSVVRQRTWRPWG